MSEWQPIESAPKDGTAILAYDPAMECWAGHPIAVVNWFDCGEDSRWNVIHDGIGDYWNDFAPTAWMPLPAPPTR